VNLETDNTVVKSTFNPADYVDDQHWGVINYLRSRPQLRTIPNHIEGVLSSIEAGEQALNHEIKSQIQLSIIQAARRAIELELAPMAERRKFEQRLAYMIAREVVPKYGAFDKSIKDLPGKLSNCRQCGKIGVDTGGDKRFFWDTKCNCSKICPDEMRYESQRLTEKYIPHMLMHLNANRRLKLQKFVISPRNVPKEKLHEAKSRLFKTWANINRRKVCEHLTGALVVQEDPLAAGDETWNVHLNVLVLVGGHFNWSAFRSEFARMWGDEDVQIDFVTEHRMKQLTEAKLRRQGRTEPATRELVLIHSINEMVKYVCKISGSDHQHSDDGNHDGDVNTADGSAKGSRSRKIEARPMDKWPGERFYEWFSANRGFRRTRSYGVLYNVPVQSEEEREVEWFGFVKWNDQVDRYEVHTSFIGLIPADKFATQTHTKPTNQQNWRPPDG